MASIKFMEACLNTKSPLFTNNAGFAYYKMEKFEESVTWLKKSIEIALNVPSPTCILATLLSSSTATPVNRNSEARPAYTKYLELAPNSNSAPDVKRARTADWYNLTRDTSANLAVAVSPFLSASSKSCSFSGQLLKLRSTVSLRRLDRTELQV
jgi:hypothetical protein